jgi:hypothetical protein
MPSADLDPVITLVVLIFAICGVVRGICWFWDKFDEMFDEKGWWE